jgi:anti-sigma regulatory factor (Ser/Thr protein kinase)
MTGLDLLAELRSAERAPRVLVMTSDDAPETQLKAVREQAFLYVHKPVEPTKLLQTVREALEAPEPPRIEVLSARSEWVELLVPCSREAVGRIEAVMAQLETNLPSELRESIGFAFRELLMNAVEWGGGLDPTRKVRISCLRSKRMILYRIADPGVGFKIEDLPHAAIGQPPDDPIAHMQVREAKGLRPGGFGLLSVRSSVDELLYNEQRNEVVFVKYLDDDAGR